MKSSISRKLTRCVRMVRCPRESSIVSYGDISTCADFSSTHSPKWISSFACRKKRQCRHKLNNWTLDCRSFNNRDAVCNKALTIRTFTGYESPYSTFIQYNREKLYLSFHEFKSRGCRHFATQGNNHDDNKDVKNDCGRNDDDLLDMEFHSLIELLQEFSPSPSADALDEANYDEADCVNLMILEHLVSSKAIASRLLSMWKDHAQLLKNLQDDGNKSLRTRNSPNNSAHNSQFNSNDSLSNLSSAASLYSKFSELSNEFTSINELREEVMNDENIEEEKDDLVHECTLEMKDIYSKMNALSDALIEAAIPKNEEDHMSASADAILEIRAGTGGDGASLFACDLLEAYWKCALGMGFRFDLLLAKKTDLGGIKEAAASVGAGRDGSGSHFHDNSLDIPDVTLGPYGKFKFESGVHRVQRVPVNDVRIHTSAVSVAVLPAPSNSNNNQIGSIPPLPTSDLQIETMRASGAGGQHVNTTDSAVRITHLPTGISVSMQDERSQHKNKSKAMKIISARVYEKKRTEEARIRGEKRNSLMGGGDRSERVRTYNYPQDRITDHRCKHSEYGITRLLNDGGSSSLSSSSSNATGNEGLVGVFEPLLRRLRREDMLMELEEEIALQANSSKV